MARRAALLAVVGAVLCPAGTAWAQDDTNQPPVIKAKMWQPRVFVNNWNELHLFDSYDPDGWIASARITEDGRVVQEGQPPWSYPFQYPTPGRRVIKIDMTDDEGATASKTVNIDVLPQNYFWPKPRPKPTIGPRFSLLVPRYMSIAEANRNGISADVECKRFCAVSVALQLTRYRARKLGLRPPRKGRLTIASEVSSWGSPEHHFILTPRARVRRALRRARKVPLLLRVTSHGLSYNNYGLTRTTQAEIELTGPRRKRRR